MSMSRKVFVLPLLAGALSAGCNHARGVGIPDGMPAGRPEFAEGLPEGYWIWQDRGGWHLRLTSDVPRRFQGAVEKVGFGGLGGVRAVGLAARGMRGDRGLIAFDLEVEGGVHGFDWTPDSGCNRFELYIDGAARPLRVFLGGAEESPGRMPFALCD